MTDSPSSHPRTFAGTHVREDASGSALVAHTLGLTVVSGCDRGARHQLEGSRMLIGSAGHCDLVLRDPMISRRHCEIHARDQGYVIRDLDSTNGTRVNDTPIVEAYLTPGARVRLGDTELLFEPRKKWQSLPEVQIDHFGELYGQSTAMRAVFAMLDKVAQTDLSCLLVGETGTGKELAAQALHQRSHRKHKNFVVVDCGAISENLTESELFGHEKG
ncbi:MAG: sigma 54-interacting transcriptional regulator, partial [Polyangiales bacterium]